jgi:hypothetical protein
MICNRFNLFPQKLSRSEDHDTVIPVTTHLGNFIRDGIEASLEGPAN